MSVTWTSVCRNPREQDELTVSAVTGGYSFKLTTTFSAYTDGNSFATPTDALTATDGTTTIPLKGATFTEGVSGIEYEVTQVYPRREGPYLWTIQITAERDEVSSDIDWTTPARRNINIDVDAVETQQSVFYDKDNLPITNSAHCFYDPALQKTIYDEKFTISYEVGTDHSVLYSTKRGKVNGSSFSFNVQGVNRTFGPRCLKLVSIRQTSQLLDNGTNVPTRVFSVVAVYVYRVDGWQSKVPDKGKFALHLASASSPGKAGSIYPIVDATGNEVTEDVFLDGNGQPIANVQIVTGDGGTPVVYKTFKIEAEDDFTSLFAGLS